MANTVEQLKQYAWLSQASYLDLNGSGGTVSNLLGSPINKDKVFASAQATQLVNDFNFIRQLPNDPYGFSATLFQSKTDPNRYIIAVRGTEFSIADLIRADALGVVLAGKAAEQAISAYRWYKQLVSPTSSSAPIYTDAEISMLRQLYLQTPEAAQAIAIQGSGVSALQDAFESSLRQDQGLNVITNTGAVIDFTGHSLGGHVATLLGDMVFEQQSGTVGEIVTYNAPGQDALPNELYNWIGLPTGRPTPIPTTNIIGEGGMSVTAGLGSMQGTKQNIFIEQELTPYGSDGGVTPNHSIVKLSDSLALYELFNKIDGNLTFDNINAILKAISADSLSSLEKGVLALYKLFNGSATAISAGDRKTYYTKVADLKTALNSISGTLSLASLTDKTPTGLASLAENSDAKAYRYALAELNPFAVLGATYSDPQLNLLDQATGIGLSDKWIAARAAMLSDVIKANIADTGNGKKLWVESSDTDLTYFGDEASGISVQETNTTTGQVDGHRVIFGAATKTLSGGSLDDKLFAGTGSETLVGGAGDDYLEAGRGQDSLDGGTGNDTYQLDALLSVKGITDTINDTDGKGSVWMGGNQLKGTTTAEGQQDGSGISWTTDDGIRYGFQPVQKGNDKGTLTIEGKAVGGSNNDSIVIQNFDLNQAQTTAGYLGITLGKPTVKIGLGTKIKSVIDAVLDKGAEVVNWVKGEVQIYTLYVTAVRNNPQKILVDLTAAAKWLGSLVGINTGASLDSLANGPVELTIPAGQDSVTVALVKTAEITGNQTIGLTAILENPDGTTPANAASDTLTFNYQGPANVTTTPDRTILGDLAPVDFSGQYHLDDLGNLVVDASKPAPGLDDILYDSSGNDLINAGDGNNFVAAFHGGNDTIMAGAGNDSIYGGAGNDVISGGGGADLVLAGNGNNQIYATAKVDIGAAIDQGAHGTASGQKGSFLAAGDGNNTLVGGLGNDAIFVGGGDNLIILGPGNDSVVAGVDVGNASSDWYTDVVNGTLTFENVNAASSPYAVPASFQGNTYNGVPVGAGNDTIFGGAGDDVRLTTMLLKSRRWRDGERNGIRSAANDSVFEIGRLG